MSVLELLELEERVGRAWDRLVGERASWPRFPDAAVGLEEMRGRLAVFFRGVGGDAGLDIAAATARTSGHRLNWRQRLGMEEERVVGARRDDVSLALPAVVDWLPDPSLNRDLYFWLAAFMAPAEPPPPIPLPSIDDPLRADLAQLAGIARTTDTVLRDCPGLTARWRRLAEAFRHMRPVRRLRGVEAEVEAVVMALLGGDPLPPEHRFAAIVEGRNVTIAAVRGYRTFLPVPLWGEVSPPAVGDRARPDDAERRDTADPREEDRSKDGERRRAKREKLDNTDRNDPLILNRFEKVMAFADMVNVNRAADDGEEEEAQKAADSMDSMALAQHDRTAATKLRFDLDLPPSAVEAELPRAPLRYPESDHRRKRLLPDHCAVFAGTAAEEGEDWEIDARTRREIRAVRRQFEALRTRVEVARGQLDGGELDTEAVVRARADWIASGVTSDRVHIQRRPMERDLAVTVLVDVSLSTDAWIENRRVLDVAKEALCVFAHGLEACGDPFSILTFTSRERHWVRVDRVKDFDEPLSPRVLRRVSAIRPGYYTRIGAAVRHATAELDRRPERRKLLLVITDGKPNDIDHYEGRHGLEDSRKAVLEARAKGLTVFGVTIDREAKSYFPHLFGAGCFAIVHHLAHLTRALPRLYRHLAAS